MSQIVLTKEGLQKLEEELYNLKTVKRPEIAEKIKEARDFGDLSENSEYEAALNAQAIMEARISQIEEQLKYAKVLDEKEIKKDVVSIGSAVTVYDEDMEEEIEYTIVSSTESDAANLKVSDSSPIGKALLGKRKGTSVEVEAPGGVFTLKILKVKRADK